MWNISLQVRSHHNVHFWSDQVNLDVLHVDREIPGILGKTQPVGQVNFVL